MIDRDRIKAARIKKVRRGIVDALKIWGSDMPMSFYELRVMFPDVEFDMLRADVDYLEKAGYVTRQDGPANTPLEKREYELTAKGITIADRINVEPDLEP